jgi:hypothetical protein
MNDSVDFREGIDELRNDEEIKLHPKVNDKKTKSSINTSNRRGVREKKKGNRIDCPFSRKLEVGSGFEPLYEVLQTSA